MTTINSLITEVMRREGWDKYTDRPNDRGGPTKWGITQASWSDYLGFPATPEDVKAITELQARVFYQAEYIVKPRFDLIEHSFIRGFVVDCAVNHGQSRAAKWLQQAASVVVDGKVGPKTLFAVNTAKPMDLFLRMVAYRIQFYGQIVTKDPTQAENAAGWNNRAAGFLLDAIGELS